jgi:hypothetical protein
MKPLSVLSLALIGVTAFPGGAVWALEATRTPELAQLIARGGGGGRMGGGGGGRTGFANAGGGGFNRGDARPSGGWSNQVRAPGGGLNPSINRPSGGNAGFSRPVGGVGDRTLGNRNFNGNLNRSTNFIGGVNRTANINRSATVNRNWNRNVNINNVNVRPGWARPGWGVARPWNTGWYGGWATPTWGWWGARAAAWGIGTLATAAVINSAVNSAINSNQTTIVVPNTDYQLLFGSVQPSGTSAVSFAVSADGSTYQLSADCNAGLIDGQEPQNAAQAELLNAACQVAFGSV